MTQSLAQLQAELRNGAAQPNFATGDDKVYVDGFDSALVMCADALSPHVEREAADLELIKRLLNRVLRHHGEPDGDPEGCPSCKVILEARARLEESKP